MLRGVALVSGFICTAFVVLVLANHKTIFHQDDWVWITVVGGEGASVVDARRELGHSWSIENAFIASHHIREHHRIVIQPTDVSADTMMEGEIVVGYTVRQEVDVYGSNLDELAAYNREIQGAPALLWSSYPRGIPTAADILVVAWLALATLSVGSFQRARGEWAEPGMSYVVVVAHVLFIGVAIVLSFFFAERELWRVAWIADLLSAAVALHWILVTRGAWMRAGLRGVVYSVGGCATFLAVQAALSFGHSPF